MWISFASLGGIQSWRIFSVFPTIVLVRCSFRFFLPLLRWCNYDYYFSATFKSKYILIVCARWFHNSLLNCNSDYFTKLIFTKALFSENQQNSSLFFQFLKISITIEFIAKQLKGMQIMFLTTLFCLLRIFQNFPEIFLFLEIFQIRKINLWKVKIRRFGIHFNVLVLGDCNCCFLK